jgi:hypothetical protein
MADLKKLDEDRAYLESLLLHYPMNEHVRAIYTGLLADIEQKISNAKG